MKNILVLTDFSENATHAAAYALSFGEKIKANLSLCNTFQQPILVPEMGGAMTFSEEYNAVIDSSLLRLNHLKKHLERKEENGNEETDFHPAINVVSSVGHLSDVIQEMILRENNELIIAGTHDKKGLTAILRSNNVKELIRNINFPLLLIPFNTDYSEIKKIGFAIELKNKDNDIAAVRKLVSFAKPLNANIMLIHIYDGVEEKFAAERHLRRILKTVLHEEDGPVITSKIYNEVTIEDGLHEVCKKENIDLLAMVHQHHGFLSRVFNSSHTGNMTDHIHIPLLVLPHEPECVK